MEHWKSVIPKKILDVHYEDLIAEQETQSRRLVAFCGLDWDDACLDFHTADRQVRTASRWQVRQPVYASSIGRWKNYRHQLEPLRVAICDGTR